MKQKFNNTGKYIDFEFGINLDESILVKKEIAIFKDINKRYSNNSGSTYWRVYMPTDFNRDNHKYNYGKIITSLFYLNPNMTIDDMKKQFTIYHNIKGFPSDYNFYKYLHNGIKSISREDCYKKEYNTVLNEVLIASENAIKLNDKTLGIYIKNEYGRLNRLLYGIKTDAELIELFYKKISNNDLCYKYLSNRTANKDGIIQLSMDRVKKKLNKNNIYINNKEIRFIDIKTGESKIIKRVDRMFEIAEDEIKWMLHSANKEFNNKKILNVDIIKKCKRGDPIEKDIITYQLKTTKLKEFFREYPYYKERIKTHNSRFNKSSDYKIVEYQKLENFSYKKPYCNDFTFLEDDIDDWTDDNLLDEIEDKYKKKQTSKIKTNNWGKVIPDFDFGKSIIEELEKNNK